MLINRVTFNLLRVRLMGNYAKVVNKEIRGKSRGRFGSHTGNNLKFLSHLSLRYRYAYINMHCRVDENRSAHKNSPWVTPETKFQWQGVLFLTSLCHPQIATSSPLFVCFCASIRASFLPCNLIFCLTCESKKSWVQSKYDYYLSAFGQWTNERT